MSNELTPIEYEGRLIPVDEYGLPWMTQKELAEWLGVVQSTVSRNIENIVNNPAIIEVSERWGLPVYASDAYTANDGKTYQVKIYNVHVLAALAMRTNSEKAVKFQVWAYDRLAHAMVGELQKRIENLQIALSHEQREKEAAEWEAETAKRELNDRLLVGLSMRYPEEFDNE